MTNDLYLTVSTPGLFSDAELCPPKTNILAPVQVDSGIVIWIKERKRPSRGWARHVRQIKGLTT
jgi:hypothetical protein